MSETVNGLTSASNGSLVYAGSVPSSHYEVRAKYRMASSGGSYVVYLRATTNANLHANTGSFYAAEVTNVSVSGGSCSGTLKLWRRDAATSISSVFFETAIACASEFDLGFAIRDGAVVVYRPDLGVVLHWVGLPQVYPSAAATQLWDQLFQALMGRSLLCNRSAINIDEIGSRDTLDDRRCAGLDCRLASHEDGQPS